MGHMFHRQPRQDLPMAVRGEAIEVIDTDGWRDLERIVERPGAGRDAALDEMVRAA